MNWRVEVSSKSIKSLAKINAKDRDKIWHFIKLNLKTPYSVGNALQSDWSENWKGLWRYRVGDYRLICEIKDHQLVVLVIEIGHRKDVYH